MSGARSAVISTCRIAIATSANCAMTYALAPTRRLRVLRARQTTIGSSPGP
jgi:hypothetical protein